MGTEIQRAGVQRTETTPSNCPLRPRHDKESANRTDVGHSAAHPRWIGAPPNGDLGRRQSWASTSKGPTCVPDEAQEANGVNAGESNPGPSGGRIGCAIPRHMSSLAYALCTTLRWSHLADVRSAANPRSIRRDLVGPRVGSVSHGAAAA
ncbi:unnamed protein product [Boreogadus saida]